jgi:hypothetical protein
MKYLSFIRSSEKYRDTSPPPALMEAMGKFVERSMLELHRKYWPEFEGECEVRPMFEPGQGP